MSEINGNICNEKMLVNIPRFSPVRHQTSSLSIYRLSGNANMVDKDDQDDNLSLSEHFLRDFQLFDQVSPLCLIQKILDRKRERSNLDRILAGGTDRERRTEELRECCQKAKSKAVYPSSSLVHIASAYVVLRSIRRRLRRENVNVKFSYTAGSSFTLIA